MFSVLATEESTPEPKPVKIELGFFDYRRTQKEKFLAEKRAEVKAEVERLLEEYDPLAVCRVCGARHLAVKGSKYETQLRERIIRNNSKCTYIENITLEDVIPPTACHECRPYHTGKRGDDLDRIGESIHRNTIRYYH